MPSIKRGLSKKPSKGRAGVPSPDKSGGKVVARGGGGGSAVTWDQDIDSGSDEDDDDDESSRKKKKKTKNDFSAGKEDGSGEDSDEAEAETAEQKRRRLAKEYLMSIQGDDDSDGGGNGDVGDDDDDVEDAGGEGGRYGRVSDSLKRERLEKQGKYFRAIGEKAASLEIADLTKSTHSDHCLSVTCVALAADEATVYSGSKDNSVVAWDLESNHRRVLRPKWSRVSHGNEQCSGGEILSVAATSDGRYLASGGRDMTVRIFDLRLAEAEIKAFQGHRDAITSLSFRRDSYSLFSGSLDRCLKHWDLNEMGYLETLFGHQDGVMAVDCWTKERPVSVSSDRTCRLWKIADETHLVFRGHKSTADAVQILTDDSFLTGGQDGSLHLWTETQKKPIASVAAAHGHDGATPRWISAVGAVKMSDYAASGSNDGNIRLWNTVSEDRKINLVNTIPLEGFVNALAVSPRLVVAGTGREHRLGRWWNCRGNRNKVVVYRLPSSLDSNSIDGEEDHDDNDDDDDDSDSADGDEEEEEGTDED